MKETSANTPSIPQGNRKAVAPDTIIQRVGEERFFRRIVSGQIFPVERLGSLSTVLNYRVVNHVLFDKITMLPQPRIGDDGHQERNIGAFIWRQAQICDMAKTNLAAITRSVSAKFCSTAPSIMSVSLEVADSKLAAVLNEMLWTDIENSKHHFISRVRHHVTSFRVYST